MSRTIVKNGIFVTLASKEEPVLNGYMVVENGTIDGLYEGEPSPETVNGNTIIDAQGKWVLPGLVNTHGHTGSALLRGAGEDDLPVQKWLESVMWPAEQTFTPGITRAANALAIGEMIKSGTTTFLDMYHLNMDAAGELIKDSGINGVLCRGMIGLCPEHEQREKLNEATDLYRNWHNEADGRIRVMLSPHAPYTCPPSFMEMIIDRASEHEISLHTHLAENRGEVETHKQQYGKRPAEHLAELGFFDLPALIAHGVHLSEKELDLFAEKKVCVSHNPVSNLKLGSGIADVPGMRKRGISVSLGTDSTASNNSLDLFEEMKMAALIHKGTSEDPTVTSAYDTLKSATAQGARSLGYSRKGRLEKGWDADFIFVDHSGMHTLPDPADRVLSHLVYASKASDVTDVYVSGRALMKNRELQTLDEEQVIANVRAAMEELKNLM
ncbi:N-ethylammeline chlorohydrolase [Alteribacter lacisalsi]|uniref:5-methylthioadenosine/S-adenosylhomocysteine deaminase n=1 Tax=Alteribacter lacisalsi TaxID=2045244 RepID=A0A2W0HND3_9BACI|nr:amidohydrolase [Alteribacter lacisalsi]PYZ98389.1 N-ethylammeline chlorohydrolase [Alteribacter lacisalsi]